MTREAVRRDPNPDGYCPVLAPNQYCQDTVHGIWHFHAPDGQRFSVDNGGGRKGAAKVIVLDNGTISFLKNRLPGKARWRDETVDCKWIVRNGFWVELPNE